MITLAVDAGNTRIKVGIFKNNVLQKVDFYPPQQFLNIPDKHEYEYVIISSVNAVDVSIHQAFGKKKLFLLNYQTKIPFVNAYQTPQTLGADRLSAIAGAYFLYPQRNVLAIDLGSCITYDFIDATGQYLGGGISPGLQMRLKAMHTFTARLPLVNLDTNVENSTSLSLIGNSTKSSLLSGAVLGAAAEITQMIRMYSDKFADLQIILCGGDAAFIAERVQTEVKIIPDLVLIGLNSILNHNLQY